MQRSPPSDLFSAQGRPTEEGEPPRSSRTIDLKPSRGEMIKASEMIDIRGVEKLTVADRRRWNLLVANAHGPNMGEHDYEWTIPLKDLRGQHKGNERVSESIRRLMTTIVEAKLPDGRTRRFTLLGGNDMDAEGRPDGLLTYSFDWRLADLLRESRTFGKFQLAVMTAFRSKYAMALYEFGSKRVRLTYKTFEEFDIDEFRAQLGVPAGKLEGWKRLNRKAVEPALLELNALAEFKVWVKPIAKGGRAVTHVRIGWHLKTPAESEAALEELQRPALGRKARITAAAASRATRRPTP